MATVIYTNSLEPNFAVIWSGAWNLIGVLTLSGAVAFGIISLLPVKLILQVGTKAGYAIGLRAACGRHLLELGNLAFWDS